LALAAVGLYGVLAYMVSLRRREIGVRLALGASPSGVARLISTQGAGLAAIGIVVGSALFLGASRFLHAHVFGVGAVDPLTIVTVSACLMAVAIASSWIPARRASRIDPATVLTGD
jgi:ABC-type antimicrobial peptide transport system permease subunit